MSNLNFIEIGQFLKNRIVLYSEFGADFECSFVSKVQWWKSDFIRTTPFANYVLYLNARANLY
jgi:hypothetical protein